MTVANTKPLTDAISRAVAYGTDVVTDEQVRASVRRLGSAVVDVGKAVVEAGRNRPAADAGRTVSVPPQG